MGQLEWLAHAVHSGQLRLPYDDRSYLSEGDLFEFARANGLDTARLHYMIEQSLLVPHRSRGDTALFNACALSDTMGFVQEMDRLGMSLEMQQVIVRELTEFEEEAWRLAVAAYRKEHPSAQPGTLADARLRVAASITVVNSMQKERKSVLYGTTEDPGREKQFKRYFALAASRRRERVQRLEDIENRFGPG